MPFEDVPDELNNRLRRLPKEYHDDEWTRYVLAAAAVLRHYLGINPLQIEDPLITDLDLEPKLLRIQMIGDLLFSMRSHKGFEEFCRRLKLRAPQLRSVYFELLAASTFGAAGFEILAKPEANIKKEDFDFQVAKGDLKMNIEVTAFTRDTFLAETVRNALDAKRKQLPATEPAMIWCVLPQSWNTVPSPAEEVKAIAKSFFAGTGRVNAITFCMEVLHQQEFAPDDVRWKVEYPSILCLHPRPRISVDLEFLNDDPFHVPVDQELRLQFRRMQSRDLYRWADFIFGIAVPGVESGTET